MGSVGPRPDVIEALEQARDALQDDLADIFGHEDVKVALVTEPGPRLVAEGSAGRFEVRWPPTKGFTVAEGRLGAHARIAFEFLLANETPGAFFDGYRPVAEERRRIMFEALVGFLDETLGGNRFYEGLQTVERGPAMLVYHDDEYAIVADNGKHVGHGILYWKVKRLIAYAMTDADEALLD